MSDRITFKTKSGVTISTSKSEFTKRSGLERRARRSRSRVTKKETPTPQEIQKEAAEDIKKKVVTGQKVTIKDIFEASAGARQVNLADPKVREVLKENVESIQAAQKQIKKTSQTPNFVSSANIGDKVVFSAQKAAVEEELARDARAEAQARGESFTTLPKQNAFQFFQSKGAEFGLASSAIGLASTGEQLAKGVGQGALFDFKEPDSLTRSEKVVRDVGQVAGAAVSLPFLVRDVAVIGARGAAISKTAIQEGVTLLRSGKQIKRGFQIAGARSINLGLDVLRTGGATATAGSLRLIGSGFTDAGRVVKNINLKAIAPSVVSLTTSATKGVRDVGVITTGFSQFEDKTVGVSSRQLDTIITQALRESHKLYENHNKHKLLD